MAMTVTETNVTPRRCALEGCSEEFLPHAPQHVYCCPAHARVARWRRRKARIDLALKLLARRELIAGKGSGKVDSGKVDRELKVDKEKSDGSAS